MARLIFFLILTSLAHAQLTPDLAPEFPESEPVRALPPAQRAENLGPVAEGTVLVNPLQVIHLHGPNDQETTELRPGVLVSPELHIPSPRTLAARLADWLGGPLTDQSLAAMADLILAHYDAEGYPVVLVDAPEQDLSSGKIQILVEVGTIGRVGLSRSKFSESKILRDGLRLQTGELLRRGALEEQIAWYGRSPFRVPRLFVSPGLTPASADLLIGFEETKPWRAYVGYDNAGTELLGEDRFRIGVAGMTKGEQIIAWQSLVGAPISSLHAHALHWEIPFHKNHHLLRLDGAFANVFSRYLSGGALIENEGTSWALTALYQVPLFSSGGWRQHLAAGFEVKGTDQFLLFGGGPISPGQVLLIHGKLEYQLARTWENGGLQIIGTALAAPGGLGNNNSDAAFRAYDPLATSDYLVGRIHSEGWWSPGADWQLRFRATGQLADGRLLPAEQFTAGGHDSVRGISERLFLADSGWQTSFEALSPQIRAFKKFDMRLLAFLDHAELDSHQSSGQSLTGTGLGIRMRISNHVDLRFDHGWRVDDDGEQSHLGITMSY